LLIFAQKLLKLRTNKMKKIAFLLLTIGTLSACAVKVPYTEDIKKEYGLDAERLKNVQFYTSATIILERTSSSGSSQTASDGSLVTTSNKEQEQVIINPQTKCVFEKFGADGSVDIRFEVGQNKTIKFNVRTAGNGSGQKFYLVAVWKQNVGGTMDYGNEVYSTPADSGLAYLMVKIRKSSKTKKKARVVKGMKV
jgi:hypothetical protein